MSNSFYDIVETSADGQEVSFKQFEGKVVYGVNVASECGYTESGYDLLSRLSKIVGVEVLVFPCNQFGAQEPGSDAEVQTFCATKGVEGAHVFAKADVNGDNARPTYQTLREIAGLGKVKWNFMGRFIVTKDGEIILPPTDEEAWDTVQSLL
mmetsp:Transcript_51329/g.89577  ORF Transcript_51329/g.89577 Transcript_51329/m.89577 type:complete len:152 (-) Transcript_51329:232-687(-)|eukprot:CAMPEP_0185013698 /NCGR_PEP_ID=MMETSP1098-20130426/98937_1 /TAXON_ID=89044 /ORGANISM="Spumella elongata, Strain CCAP 955/1" /LENGTH=151 /DNA_ID=CAMNT_0027542765 /DNA_START=30 /DNA_END=485 /DNA_ORIENTATION=+